MNTNPEYISIFTKDAKNWLTGIHRGNIELLEQCDRNADKLASLLRRDIQISKDFENVDSQIVSCYHAISLVKEFEKYSQKVSDHYITIKDIITEEVIGYVVSLYIVPKMEYLMDINGQLTHRLSELLKDVMAPEILEQYNVCVLNPQLSLYYPGLTASILFLKK